MSAAELEKLIGPLVELDSAELVHLTYAKEGSKFVLRVFLDKEGGITLDDCSYFSDRIGAMLDAMKTIDRSYILEVSSPGLDRVIKKEKDFVRFAGKTVKIRLKLPDQGQRNFTGILKGFQDGKVLVECEGRPKEFAHSAIEEVRIDSTTEVEKRL
jgi:ribosome maturation factor RimP